MWEGKDHWFIIWELRVMPDLMLNLEEQIFSGVWMYGSS